MMKAVKLFVILMIVVLNDERNVQWKSNSRFYKDVWISKIFSLSLTTG